MSTFRRAGRPGRPSWTGAHGLVSYNATISACQKGEQWQWGLALLREIREMNMYPGFFVYGSVASMCEQGGQGKLVQSLTREVCGLISAG